MSLADLELDPEYRSDRASLALRFFLPCLRQTRRYDRAVGYFCSSSLTVLADGLGPFIESGGLMRVVASPRISAEDADALQQGYEQRARLVDRAVADAIDEIEGLPDPERARLECLAWLIAHERLDMRLALVVTPEAVGIYHEKLGVFEDDGGEFVAFAGSANESYGGLVANFEAIDVFRSWLPADRERAEAKRIAFARLWDGVMAGIETYAFPEAARRQLLELAPRTMPTVPNIPAVPSYQAPSSAFGFPSYPTWFKARDYQRAAVESWLQAGGRGIFAMATGTGKTLTAMTAMLQVARRAHEQGQSLLLVVVCPQKHLVEQWADDARSFGVDPVVCFESSEQWAQIADASRMAINHGRAPFAMWITTITTFIGQPMQRQLAHLSAPPGLRRRRDAQSRGASHERTAARRGTISLGPLGHPRAPSRRARYGRFVRLLRRDRLRASSGRGDRAQDTRAISLLRGGRGAGGRGVGSLLGPE